MMVTGLDGDRIAYTDVVMWSHTCRDTEEQQHLLANGCVFYGISPQLASPFEFGL